MAAKPQILTENLPEKPPKIVETYLGVSFAVFLGLLPKSAAPHLSSLQSRNRILSLKLFQVEDQLRGLRSRRKEDSKANARVVEIFATHRQAWRQGERRLALRAEAAEAEAASLEERVTELEAEVERLEREVGERDELIEFVMRKDDNENEEEEEEEKDHGEGFGDFRACSDEIAMAAAAAAYYGENTKYYYGGFGSVRDFLSSMGDSKSWMERSTGGQQQGFITIQTINPSEDFIFMGNKDKAPVEAVGTFRLTLASGYQLDLCQTLYGLKYDSLETVYHMKNFVARKESPWKVEGDSTVSSKLKLLEEELTNLEKLGKGDLSKVSSLMRKQAKRYQSLTWKIDDLCRRMQASDPCEPTLSPEFRSQQQTEFLLEAVHLQHCATEARQKLSSLQAETTKTYTGDELAGHSKLSTRRALDTIGNNFKEIQRNLEIWLARIIGDVEGILASNGASRVRDYYVPHYPFVR